MSALPTLTLPTGYERRIEIDLDQPCWPWEQTLRPHGYGEVMIDGEKKYPHRLAYQLHVGPIPRGWEVDHACHSAAVEAGECAGGDGCVHRSCWNPHHLEALSSRENSMRGNHPLFSVARLQVCRQGHDLTIPENVYIYPDGHKRRCRVCMRAAERRRRRT